MWWSPWPTPWRCRGGWAALLPPLVLLLLTAARAEECTQGFSVVASEVGVPGRPTAVLVTLHDVTPATNVTPERNVTLRLSGSSSTAGAPAIFVQTTTLVKGRGIIPLHIPQDASGLCTLQTVVECESVPAPAPAPAAAPAPAPAPAPAGPCPLTATADLRMLPPVRDVIVRADRVHAAPGDSVGFWILALSHAMTLPSDVLASVSVRDPAGTKVAVWEDVALDQGVRSFSFTLSPGAALGRWRLEVAVEESSFGADLNVSLSGPDESWSWGWGWSLGRPAAPALPQQPTGAAAPPEVAMAEEHFVELRFGNGMRRVYKPNMPFIGKVEAVSSERSVRVRIKLYDNTTAIYSQDVEISSGEATFVVPSIMADSMRITMQAELVSVEGKEIESHYVLAREDIYRWNSTSRCFLLVEGVEKTMEVGEEARVRVLSTCPCRADLHYVVTTQGHVTFWSDRQGSTVETTDAGGAVCQTNISFTVDATMAPVSRLLVYYVTAGGEPVSDVTTFDVRLLDKRMSISFEQKSSWSPGEAMDVEVLAEENALICLVGGRVPNKSPAVVTASRPSSRAVDFLDAGLSLYERQCVTQGRGGAELRFHQARSQPQGQDALSGLRRLQLDQLWLWRCLNYSSRVASEGVTLTVPEGAGQWTLWGLSLSPAAGLRFSDATTFTVFRPLGVDFRLPRSLRVGEVLEVGVKIANNLNSCVDVSALLSLRDGAHFQSSGLGFVSERLRLGPHGATSLVVRVQATAQSSNNLTAEVVAHAASSCQAPAVYGPESDATAKVVRSAPFRVQPEGLTRLHTESAYFCANERVMISTTDNFRFDFVAAPRNREAIVLEVRAGQGARVALSDQAAPTDWMYQVVIGDADNTISWIGRGKHEYSVHLSSAKTPNILSSVKGRTFWVSWEQNTVRFGRGAIVGKDILLKWRLIKKMKVNFVGFASSWGQTADFRVWNFNDEAGYSQVLHLDVPRSVVPGSERGTLLVAGGMALPGAGVGAGHSRAGGPQLQHTEQQQQQQQQQQDSDIGLQQPLPGREAGESSSLAATVSAFAALPSLRHLPSNSSSSAEYQRRVLDSLRLRLQDLVAFLHPDGSFGDHKSHGSHRSTVAVLELLTEAQAYFSVDAELVAATKRWVQSRQDADGSFAPPLADLRDGAEDVSPAPTGATTTTTQAPDDAATSNASTPASLELEQRIETTAETLVTLLEVGVENDRDSEAVVRARYFLERHLYAPRGPVALAALCLALVRSRSDVAGAALARMRAASVNQEGDFSWPVEQTLQIGAWLADDTPPQDSSHRREPLRLNVGEFRASLYALLTHCYRRDLSAAEPVARYLFYRAHLLDIHPELTYLSVKAFSAFGQLARDEHRALTVSLATSGMELTDTLELRPGSPPASLVLPSLPTKVFVYATGAGCATVQGLVQYSTYLPRSSTPLLDLWAGVEGEIPPPRNSLEELEGKQPILRLKACFRWKGQRPSGVLRLDVTLFSGFELLAMNGISVEDTGNETDVHHGARGDRVWVVLNNVSARCAVCVHFAARSSHVISGLRPAFARVYPSARSDLAAETFFHTHRGSSLLAGITEDDIVTWFGRSEDAGEVQMSSNFNGICECGKKCSSDAQPSAPASPAPSRSRPMDAVTVVSSTEESVTASTTTAEEVSTSTAETDSPTTSAASSTVPTTITTTATMTTSATSTTSTTTTTATTSAPAIQPPVVVSALPDLHYEINRPHSQQPEQQQQPIPVELQLLPDAKPSSPPTAPRPQVLSRSRAAVAHLTSTTIRAPLRDQKGKTVPASLHHHHAAPQPDVAPQPEATPQPHAAPQAHPALPPHPAPPTHSVPQLHSTPQPHASPQRHVAQQPHTATQPHVSQQPHAAQQRPQQPPAAPLRAGPDAKPTVSVASTPRPTSTSPSPSTTLAAQRRADTAGTQAPTPKAPSSVNEPRKAKKMGKVGKKVAAGGDGAKKSEGKTPDIARQTHSVAINTPVQARAGPEMTTEEPPVRGPQALEHGQGGAGVAAAEHNPLWGLLREVVGPEDGNAADAEVMPSTISEETKDEEQQDEDEEKLSFD